MSEVQPTGDGASGAATHRAPSASSYVVGSSAVGGGDGGEEEEEPVDVLAGRFSLLHHPTNAQEERLREVGQHEHELALAAEQLVETKDFTWRAIILGSLVGGLMCFSNMYFGLQSGWVTLGSLQSALLGFAALKVITAPMPSRPGLVSRILGMGPFGPKENVLLTSAAVATATMPLAGGFVGILPAIGLLTDQERGSVAKEQPWWALFLWSFALAFFGVFFAVPLRKQTILREKLPFPSGTATAHLIKILHGQAASFEKNQEFELVELNVRDALTDSSPAADELHFARITRSDPRKEEEDSMMEKDEWERKWLVLYLSFAISSIFIVLGYFFPVLQDMPILSWLGLPAATKWGWSLRPSLGYVGQGMIMGPRTGVSLLTGAVVGWAVLGPTVQMVGWAPGPVSDWQTGARGWLLWISLSMLLSETITSLLVLVGRAAVTSIRRRTLQRKETEETDPAPPQQQVPRFWWMSGLLASSALCVVIITPLYHLPIWQPMIAVVLALLVSVLAIRALGETDINPVSGVGKISQIVFAVLAPKSIVSNIIAGAIAEAGALQAGDMMQDLKMGHLLKASPRAQFFAQLLGSFASVFFSVAAYLLYTTAYQVPGPQFPVPTAEIWVSMARMVSGEIDAHNVLPFCIIAGVFTALLTILGLVSTKFSFLPSWVGFAIGLYLTPNWTLPRVAGSLVHWVWLRKWPVGKHNYMVIVASGFVLGEGAFSILTALFTALGIAPLT